MILNCINYGWFGWEDYDLWLRIAEAGLHVSFLPNVLCLYRHHDRAMSNTTNLFERELVAHLFEKHRALIEKYPPKRRILGVNRSGLSKRPKRARTPANRWTLRYDAMLRSNSRESSASVTHLTRSQRVREKDSDCSKDLALEHQTSVGA